MCTDTRLQGMLINCFGLFCRVLKFLQTLRVVQNNEPIRDKLKQYREAYNYGTESGLSYEGDDENFVNSVCSEYRYPCRSTQKSLQRSTRALVDFAGFWKTDEWRLHILYINNNIYYCNTIFVSYGPCSRMYSGYKIINLLKKKKNLSKVSAYSRVDGEQSKLCNLLLLKLLLVSNKNKYACISVNWKLWFFI